MTITPVSTSSIESAAPESASDAPASGFDVLLAGARAAKTGDAPKERGAESSADSAAPNITDVNHDPGTDTPAGTDPKADATNDTTQPALPGQKQSPSPQSDVSGLLAVLASLGWTPPKTAAPAAALTGDTSTEPAATSPPAATAPTTATPIAATVDLSAEIAPVIDLTPTPAAAPGTASAASASSSPTLSTSELTAAVEAILTTATAAAEPQSATPAADQPARPVTKVAVTEALAPPRTEPASSTVSAPTPAASNSTPPAADPKIVPAATVNLASDPAAATVVVDANPAATQGAPGDHARPALVTAAAPATTAADTNSTALLVNPPLPTTAPTETAPVEHVATAPTAAQPPAEQLVSVLTPLRNTTNGTYTLRLELKPPELGRVEMRVDMKDGVMHASIHSDREGSAQLLRDALGELRDRLEAANVRTGDLTVSEGGVGARDHRGANTPGQTDLGTGTDPTNTSDATVTNAVVAGSLGPEATSLLDVRV